MRSDAGKTTCATCPCKCLYEGGLTGAVLAYGSPPAPIPDTAILPFDDMGMMGSLYQDASTSPELAANVATPTQTQARTPTSRRGAGPGVEQFPFPQQQRRGGDRDRDRDRDRSLGPGFPAVGARGKGIGGGRRGEGSPRRSMSVAGRGDLRSTSASGIGVGGGTSSGFNRLARGTTAAAAPPTAAASSSHARGLSNISAIGGGTGLGLGLGLGSVAEQAHEGASALNTPTTPMPAVPIRGEAQGQVSVPAPTTSKGWYGYANPYANFTAKGMPGTQTQGSHDSSASASDPAAGGQQAQAQGAQGLLARARAAMDAGGAWR